MHKAIPILNNDTHMYQYIRADSIEFFEDDSEPLWDIEVEDNNSFVLADGGGVVVHNSAKQGRSRETQAILPLRGKVLNVEKSDMIKMLKNNEISALVSSLGTNVGAQFNLNKLRYHKVILMCDRDVDGAHITTLLLTFFFKYMKPLINAGHLYLAQPPLYKIKQGKKVYYAGSDVERDELIKKFDEKGKKYTITRFKGLGEMNGKELADTTMNISTRTIKRVTINDAEVAEKMITTLMGNDIPARKKFIQEHALNANIDI